MSNTIIVPGVIPAAKTARDVDVGAAERRAAERDRELAREKAERIHRDGARDRAAAALETKLEAARRELSKDKKCGPASLATAIEFASRDCAPPLFALWRDLKQVYSIDVDRIDALAMVEARHCLAGDRLLPPVRKDDAIFGVVNPRHLPNVVVPDLMEIDALWFDGFCRDAGIGFNVRAPAPPAGALDREWERICGLRDRGAFDADPLKNHALAHDAYEAARARHGGERSRLGRMHTAKGVELRKQLLEVVDADLQTRELGAGWWWSRQVRRQLAGEPRRVDDFSFVLGMCGALGVVHDFSKVAKALR